jgi:hypothetical protein
MIAVALLTDGRPHYIERTIPSLEEMVAPIDRRVIFDDSGDHDYAAGLTRRFPRWEVEAAAARTGYAAAVRRALSCAAELGDFVFVSEDDFVYQRPVDLVAIAEVMVRRRLAQMVLPRQPWYPVEHRGGGILQRFGGGYVEHTDGDLAWVEHRLFWSMNPHLVASDFLLAHPWPLGDHSEARFGQAMFATGVTAGMWGRLGDAPYVEHIGRERVGTGY